MEGLKYYANEPKKLGRTFLRLVINTVFLWLASGSDLHLECRIFLTCGTGAGL